MEAVGELATTLCPYKSVKRLAGQDQNLDQDQDQDLAVALVLRLQQV
jgi:hypothetical protein